METVKQIDRSENQHELNKLCFSIRQLVEQHKYEESELLIQSAIGSHPHSPVPHNLIGILLEKKGDHLTAMKHFRAAWALDPTYLPAQHNLEHYGTFFSKGKCAYDETDCLKEKDEDLYKVEYDEHGIGHVVRRKKHEKINK